MKVSLRLAFIDSRKVNCVLLKNTKTYVRRKGLIGRVIVEKMVDRDVARLHLIEFGNLRDYDQRDADADVHATLFSKLKEILNKLDVRVNTKYLMQNRQMGANHLEKEAN